MIWWLFRLFRSLEWKTATNEKLVSNYAWVKMSDNNPPLFPFNLYEFVVSLNRKKMRRNWMKIDLRLCRNDSKWLTVCMHTYRHTCISICFEFLWILISFCLNKVIKKWVSGCDFLQTIIFKGMSVKCVSMWVVCESYWNSFSF